LPEQIRKTESRIESLENDIENLKNHANSTFSMTVSGVEFRDKEEAGKALIEMCQKVKADSTLDIGSYKGFETSIHYDSFRAEFNLYLKHGDSEYSHKVTLCKTPKINLERIDAEISLIPQKLVNSREQLTSLHGNLETAKSELGKPFPREDELKYKQARLAEVNLLLEAESKQAANPEKSDVPVIETRAKKVDKAADRLPTNLTERLTAKSKEAAKRNANRGIPEKQNNKTLSAEI